MNHPLHLFHIHSPLTYRIALAVIQKNSLDTNSVVLLYSNYKPRITNITNQYPSYSELLKQKKWISMSYFNHPQRMDDYISTLTHNQEFIAYVDLMHYFQKIIVTHPRCISFNFLEEGMSCYFKPDTLDDLTRITGSMDWRSVSLKYKLKNILFVLKGFNLRLLAIPYFAHSFSFMENVHCYCLNDEAFPGFPDERKVILPLNDTISQQTSHFGYDGVIFLIEESFFTVYGVLNSARQTLETTVDYILKNYPDRRLIIKLRPNMPETKSIWSTVLSSRCIEYEVFQNETALEDVLILSKDCLLFGSISALLYYGSVYGHLSFSNYFLLEKFHNRTLEGMSFYWSKVRKITKYES